MGIGVQSFLGLPSYSIYDNSFVIPAGFFLCVFVLFVISRRKLIKGLRLRETLWHAIEKIRTLAETNPDSVKEIIFNDKDFFGDATLQTAFEEYQHDSFKMNDISKDSNVDVEYYINQKLLDEAIGVNFLDRISEVITVLSILGLFIKLYIRLRSSYLLSWEDILLEMPLLVNEIKVATHIPVIGLGYSLIYGFFYNRQLSAEKVAMDKLLDVYHRYIVPVDESSSVEKSKSTKDCKRGLQSGNRTNNDIKDYCCVCGSEVSLSDKTCPNCGIDIERIEAVSSPVVEEAPNKAGHSEKKRVYVQCKKIAKILWDGLFSLILAYAVFIGCRCYRLIHSVNGYLSGDEKLLFLLFFAVIVFTFLCHRLPINKNRIIKYALLLIVVMLGSTVLLLEWETTISNERQMQEQQMEFMRPTLEAQKKFEEQESDGIQHIGGGKKRLVENLKESFDEADSEWGSVYEGTACISFESNILFEHGQKELTAEGKEYLDAFVEKYIDIILDTKYGDHIAEIIIEGHTDDEGDYFHNIELSQQRALAVAEYCFGTNSRIFKGQKKKLDRARALISVNGRGSNDLKYLDDDKQIVDKEGSRRVDIIFRLTPDEMILDLAAIFGEK